MTENKQALILMKLKDQTSIDLSKDIEDLLESPSILVEQTFLKLDAWLSNSSRTYSPVTKAKALKSFVSNEITGNFHKMLAEKLQETDEPAFILFQILLSDLNGNTVKEKYEELLTLSPNSSASEFATEYLIKNDSPLIELNLQKPLGCFKSLLAILVKDKTNKLPTPALLDYLSSVKAGDACERSLALYLKKVISLSDDHEEEILFNYLEKVIEQRKPNEFCFDSLLNLLELANKPSLSLNRINELYILAGKSNKPANSHFLISVTNALLAQGNINKETLYMILQTAAKERLCVDSHLLRDADFTCELAKMAINKKDHYGFLITSILQSKHAVLNREITEFIINTDDETIISSMLRGYPELSAEHFDILANHYSTEIRQLVALNPYISEKLELSLLSVKKHMQNSDTEYGFKHSPAFELFRGIKSLQELNCRYGVDIFSLKGVRTHAEALNVLIGSSHKEEIRFFFDGARAECFLALSSIQSVFTSESGNLHHDDYIKLLASINNGVSGEPKSANQSGLAVSAKILDCVFSNFSTDDVLAVLNSNTTMDAQRIFAHLSSMIDDAESTTFSEKNIDLINKWLSKNKDYGSSFLKYLSSKNACSVTVKRKNPKVDFFQAGLSVDNEIENELELAGISLNLPKNEEALFGLAQKFGKSPGNRFNVSRLIDGSRVLFTLSASIYNEDNAMFLFHRDGSLISAIGTNGSNPNVELTNQAKNVAKSIFSKY